MKISKRTALGVAGVAAVAFSVPAMAGGNKYPSEYQSQTCQDQTGNDAGTVALTGPETLWPPNHQMVDESVTAHDNNGQQATLTVTPSLTDVSGGDGGPTHDPDYQPSGPNGFMASGSSDATVNFQVRAERSGKGDGRTYTIDWSATFDNGLVSCNSSDGTHQPFTISVPHDMRGGADWNATKA